MQASSFLHISSTLTFQYHQLHLLKISLRFQNNAASSFLSQPIHFLSCPSVRNISLLCIMCVEVYANYVCGHVVPVWVPCSTLSLFNCPKYQRQYRSRPLRCSCTCAAQVPNESATTNSAVPLTSTPFLFSTSRTNSSQPTTPEL